MEDPVWDLVSDSAKDFIAHLLLVDPSNRLTVSQVLEHPWLREEDKTVHKQALLTVSRMRSSMKMRGLPPPEALGLSPEEVAAMDGGEAAAAVAAVPSTTTTTAPTTAARLL